MFTKTFGVYTRGDRIARTIASFPPYYVTLPVILISLVMLIPCFYIVFRALEGLESAWSVLFSIRTLETLTRSLLLMSTVTFFSVLFGVPMAWASVRSDLPLRRMWTVLAMLPLVIPSFVGAYLFYSAFGPKGILQQFVGSFLGIDAIPDIHGLFGATLVLSLLSYPYLFLTVRAAMADIDWSTEETARNLGHGSFSTFMRVTLPQLRSSIIAGALLVSLYTLSDFGAVSLMRYNTFTWTIFQQYQSIVDRSVIAVISLALVSLAILVIIVQHRVRGTQKSYRIGRGASRKGGIVGLGAWKIPVIMLFLGVVTVALVLPMSILAFWLFRGIFAGEPISLLWGATFNSLSVSVISAFVTTMMSIFMALVLVRHPTFLNRFLEPISFIGYALPGVVVAISLVFFAVHYTVSLYQTLPLLIIAYVILFFPVALGSTRSALQQININIDESARDLGHSYLGTVLKVTIPIMKSGLLMGVAMTFLLTMKELPATLILGPIGFKTLATSVWAASSEAFFAQAAAPALVLIIISSIPLTMIVIREKRTYF